MDSANFVISDTIGKEVVYSTSCLKNSLRSTEGSQTFLEVSKVINKKRMPGDSKETLKHVDGALDIINGSLLVGAVFTPPPGNLIFAALAGVGGIIQAGLNFFGGGGSDPVKEKMDLLASKVKELDKKTEVHFANLKSFITENQFSLEIVTEISTLKKYRNDCLEFQNEDSIESFRSAYENSPPLNIGYVLMSLLNQKSTNPLLMELMNKDPKAESTVTKWESILNGIVGDLLLIEAFGAGLLKEKDIHDWERLWEIKEEIQTFVWQLREGYWEEFRKSMTNYLDTHGDLTHAQMADDIVSKLDQAITQDAFYVCVFKYGDWNRYYSSHCPDYNAHVISVWNDNVIIYIYRSRRANYSTKNEYDWIEKEVKGTEEKDLKLPSNLENVIKDQLLAERIVRGDGFVFLVKKEGSDLQVRSSNSYGRTEGPGSWRDTQIESEKYTLLVALP